MDGDGLVLGGAAQENCEDDTTEADDSGQIEEEVGSEERCDDEAFRGRLVVDLTRDRVEPEVNEAADEDDPGDRQIGRASCRERVLRLV